MTRWHWAFFAVVVAGAVVVALSVENKLVGVWLGLSIVGAFVSAHLSNESRLDLIALGHDGNGRHRIAWSRLIRETGRLTVHIGYILSGLTAVDVIDIDWFILPSLIWGNIVLVTNSLIDANTRRLLWVYRETDLQREDREEGVIRRTEQGGG